MADLPREAAEGIAAARPEAEAKLRAALGKLPGNSDRVETWLPPFKDYAAALFDGGARGAAGLFKDRNEVERFLEETLLPEVVERIMPERSLHEALAGERPPRSFVVEDDSQVYQAEGYEAGKRIRAPRAAQVLFQIHGDLEYFLSEAGFRSKLFPDELNQFGEGLAAHLRRRVPYWADRAEKFRQGQPSDRVCRTPPPAPETPAPTFPVQSWPDLEIRFLANSPDVLQASGSGQTQIYHYSELGLANISKHKTAPKRCWGVLRRLASLGGQYPYREPRRTRSNQFDDEVRYAGATPPKASRGRGETTNWRLKAETEAQGRQALRKRIQELRKAFRKHFGPAEDPFPLVREGGAQVYRAAFRVSFPPNTEP